MHATFPLLAFLALSTALPAQSLGLADITLGTPADPAATVLYAGHSIALEVSAAAPGEIAYLLTSGPTGFMLDLHGVPIVVDPLTFVVLGVQSVDAQGATSFAFTVPATVQIGKQVHSQVILFDFPGLMARATNGLVLTSASEPFSTLLQGSQSGHPLALTGGAFTITTQAQWTSFWDQHASYLIPPPPAPPVDFGLDAVVCAFAGWQPTSGYTLTLDSVVYTGGALDIHGTLQQPGPGCVTLQVLTYPFHFVLVDASVAAAAQLAVTTLEYSCG